MLAKIVSPRHATPTGKICRNGDSMMDFIMLAIGLAFFALSIGYCYASDRL